MSPNIFCLVGFGVFVCLLFKINQDTFAASTTLKNTQEKLGMSKKYGMYLLRAY